MNGANILFGAADAERKSGTPPEAQMQSKRPRSWKSDPHQFFYLVKLYAFEIALTIIFLGWLAKIVWRELR